MLEIIDLMVDHRVHCPQTIDKDRDQGGIELAAFLAIAADFAIESLEKRSHSRLDGTAAQQARELLVGHLDLRQEQNPRGRAGRPYFRAAIALDSTSVLNLSYSRRVGDRWTFAASRDRKVASVSAPTSASQARACSHIVIPSPLGCDVIERDDSRHTRQRERSGRSNQPSRQRRLSPTQLQTAASAAP